MLVELPEFDGIPLVLALPVVDGPAVEKDEDAVLKEVDGLLTELTVLQAGLIEIEAENYRKKYPCFKPMTKIVQICKTYHFSDFTNNM